MLGLGEIAQGWVGERSSPFPQPSPHQSPCPDYTSHINVSLPKELSGQAQGRLGPKTTEGEWVNGSTPHSGHEECMSHVSPWLDPQLGIPNQLVPQLVLAPVTRPPPAVTLSITCPPPPSLYLFHLCLASELTPLWDFLSLTPKKLPVPGHSSSVSLLQSLREPQSPSPLGRPHQEEDSTAPLPQGVPRPLSSPTQSMKTWILLSWFPPIRARSCLYIPRVTLDLAPPPVILREASAGPDTENPRNVPAQMQRQRGESSDRRDGEGQGHE